MALFGNLLRSIPQLSSFPKSNIGAQIGQQVANAGAALHLPEMHISEAFAGYNQPGQTQAATTSSPITQPQGPGGAYPIAGGNQGGTYNPAPSTGGQAPATGGQAPSGGGGISPDQAYLQQLRDAFGQQKQGYENQIGSYDSDFANQKSATDAAIAKAQDTLGQQNQADDVLYGQNLKNLLQSDQEVRNRSRGTYSALGTLDSSSYLDDTNKQDQSLLNNQQQLGTARDQTKHSRESQFNDYQNQATTGLNAYQNEINRAKEGLRQAESGVDLNQANSIQSYLQQLQQQQAQQQQQQQALQMNLAQLQAQGVDVAGNLAKTNLGGFSNQFGSQIQDQLTNGLNRYTTPTSNAIGQGYINPFTGKTMTDEERKLLMGLNQ